MDTSGLDFSYPPLPYHSHILPAILPPLTPSTADTPTPPPDYRPLSLFPPQEQSANGQPIPAHSAPSAHYAIPAQTSIPQTSSPSNLLYQSQGLNNKLMHVPPHKDSRNGTNDGRSRIAYKIAELGDYIHACCLVARKPIGVCDIYMGREFFFPFSFSFSAS